MTRKADVKGGNGDVIFDNNAGTARKYLRNNSSKEKISRFQSELKIFQEFCKHPIPNIVEITNVYIDNDNITESYIEMKKYDGSLYSIFKDTRGNVKYTLKLILPIIETLYALTQGNPPLYHRDIKPDNILLLNENGKHTLFLTDFGTCFLNDGRERLTPETTAVGPRMFIAPEYETGRVEEVSEKGDIFSIGKVIWCMINGDEDELLPSNFWFVDEYNLTKRYPDNPDMIVANTIISSCLAINPAERSSYPVLIEQIQKFINEQSINASDEMSYKITQYQEKRRMELLEIKEKNRLIVNFFSRIYLAALNNLITQYPDFELTQILYDEYCKRSRDGVEFTSINVENNSAHYLYSRTYDRIYYSINYNPANGSERYCNITLSYHISSGKNSISPIRIYYSENNSILCKYNETAELLTEHTMTQILNSIIMDYIA